MPNRVVEVLIRARDTSATVLGRFRRRMRAVRRTVRNVTRTIVAGTAAIGAMVLGLTKLGERGDKVNAVKRAFAKITGDETAALQGLRRAAQGTISDFELMSLANQAMTLGAAGSVEQFAEMVEVSRALARAQGIDARKGLESLTIGLARQSPRILDNIGIQIKLGDATTFAARAMEQARRKAAEYTAEVEPGTAASTRFSTAVANLRDQLAEFVAKSPEVAEAFDFGTEILGNIADIVQGRNIDLIIAGMKAIGRAMGDALAFGFNKAIEAGIDKGNFFGRWVAGKFGERAEDNLAELRNELGQLGVIAAFARQQIEGRDAGQPPTPPAAGADGTFDPALLGGLTGPGATLTARTLPGVVTTEQRQSFLRRRERGLFVPEVESLAGTGGDLGDAAEGFEAAGQVAVASFASMTEAVIRGSEQIEVSIINMVTNILRSLDSFGGLPGAIIGGVGGIFGALLSRGRDPVPIRMADVDDRAARKLRDNSREPIHITSIIEQGGVEVARIERELLDRQNRDETVRIGVDGRPLRGG